MAQENTQGQPPSGATPPGELPVVGDKKLFTHTMKEDVARSKMDPAAFAKEVEARKPFAQFIPPASPVAGAEPQTDKFREVIEPAIPERDQPFPLPETQAGTPAVPEFQVRIPTQKKALSGTTIALVVILLLLIGGGAAGYWWFFMRTTQPEVIVQIPEKPAPAPQPIEPQPIPIPTPAPEPIPEPIPIPTPIEEPATTTPSVEPAATTTPPVVEPVVPPEPAPQPAPVVEASVPEAVLALDHTVTIALSQNTKTEALEKISAENAKIAEATTTIRYVFIRATPTGPAYLSGTDVATLLGVTIPESVRSLAPRTDLVAYKNGGVIRYGFASAISGKSAMQAAASAWENTMLSDLAGLYIEKMYEMPATISFASNTYRSFSKRFVNLPEPALSLDWGISNTHFIIATSKDMIFALIDKAAQAKK